MVWARVSWKLRPTRNNTGSTWRTPEVTLKAIGKKHDSAPMAIFEPPPTPNITMNTGRKMILGVGARYCR